jgi:hypothetical protein
LCEALQTTREQLAFTAFERLFSERVSRDNLDEKGSDDQSLIRRPVAMASSL